jgi:leucyl-tRNA synthetase
MSTTLVDQLASKLAMLENDSETYRMTLKELLAIPKDKLTDDQFYLLQELLDDAAREGEDDDARNPASYESLRRTNENVDELNTIIARLNELHQDSEAYPEVAVEGGALSLASIAATLQAYVDALAPVTPTPDALPDETSAASSDTETEPLAVV